MALKLLCNITNTQLSLLSQSFSKLFPVHRAGQGSPQHAWGTLTGRDMPMFTDGQTQNEVPQKPLRVVFPTRGPISSQESLKSLLALLDARVAMTEKFQLV